MHGTKDHDTLEVGKKPWERASSLYSIGNVFQRKCNLGLRLSEVARQQSQQYLLICFADALLWLLRH